MYNKLNILLNSKMKELRRNVSIVSRDTNLSKLFFIILLRTNFGRECVTVKSVVKDFFENEIKNEKKRGDSNKVNMIQKSNFYDEFYNRSRDLEIWRYVYRLEGQHHLIETLPKRMPKSRRKKDDVRRDVKVNVMLDEVYDYFLLAVLSKMRVSKRDVDVNLKDIIYDFNSLRTLKAPLGKIFRDEEIRSFIFSKEGSHIVNPFLLAVDRFYKISYLLHKELTSNALKHRKKIEDILEIKKRTDPYLKAILMFSSLFGKKNIQYNAPYDFEEASKIEIEKEFNRICGSDVDNERKEITKLHCKEYWENVVRPLIEIKKEYYNFVEKLKERDLIEAVNVIDNNEDYWFEGDEMYDKLDMSFPANEDKVKEMKEILEKIKKRYGF